MAAEATSPTYEEDAVICMATPPRYELTPSAPLLPTPVVAYDEAKIEKYAEVFSTPKVQDSTNTTTNTDTATSSVLVGPDSVRAVCPFCHVELMTSIKLKNNTRTHLIATLMGITTCMWCIPYLNKTYKNVNHYCSSCGAYLGTYRN